MSESGASEDLSRWQALALEVPARAADELVGHLDFGRGSSFDPTAPGRTGLRIYLPVTLSAPDAMTRAQEVLAIHGLDVDSVGLRIEEVEDGRWVERYQASLQPFPMGRRFQIFPSGEAGELEGREPILLIPGRAFGTGEHATTRLCSAQLERRVQPDSDWFDLGCGSGILSIVAARCGAGRVLAVDLDEEAVQVACEVLTANGLAGEVEIRQGTAASASAQAWDGVVANIHAPIFLQEAAQIASRLRPGGLLIASGFLIDHVADVTASLERAGLRFEERDSEGPWAVITARCPAAPEN